MLQDPASPEIQSRPAGQKAPHAVLLGENEDEENPSQDDTFSGSEGQVNEGGPPNPWHEAREALPISIEKGEDRSRDSWQPSCNVESHRDLLRRAEEAENRCNILEIRLQLADVLEPKPTDPLEELVHRAEAAEVSPHTSCICCSSAPRKSRGFWSRGQ